MSETYAQRDKEKQRKAERDRERQRDKKETEIGKQWRKRGKGPRE